MCCIVPEQTPPPPPPQPPVPAKAPLVEDRLDIEAAWTFWESIVMKDGVLDLEQVKRELTDWYFVMGEVGKVYDWVTGGLLSKVTYPAQTVIDAAEENLQRERDDAVTVALTGLMALVEEQAKDQALWSVPVMGRQPISEAYLQDELRKLHTAIQTL